MTIYNSFIKPHLDYGDVAHDWASNLFNIVLWLQELGQLGEPHLSFFKKKNPSPKIQTLAEKITPVL